MVVTSLGLHITDRCNARCLHCVFSCGPEIKGCMKLEEVRNYLQDARALGTEIICVTGGEPMLHPSLVKKIISESSRLSFPQTWLFTNGFWANNASKAHETVEKLRGLGLTKMFLSVDFFHQSYVPIEFVKNAIEASLKSSLEVDIDSRFLGNTEEENKFNSATHGYLASLRDLLMYVGVMKAQPMFVGRAADSLAKHARFWPLSEIMKEKCPGAWAGGTLDDPSGVDVDELGFVSVCPGLSIGNALDGSLGKIVAEYDYRDFDVIAALCEDGLQGLLSLASTHGYVPKGAYVSACHLCYETRKFLRSTFPEAFTLLTDRR